MTAMMMLEMLARWREIDTRAMRGFYSFDLSATMTTIFPNLDRIGRNSEIRGANPSRKYTSVYERIWTPVNFRRTESWLQYRDIAIINQSHVREKKLFIALTVGQHWTGLDYPLSEIHDRSVFQSTFVQRLNYLPNTFILQLVWIQNYWICMPVCWI